MSMLQHSINAILGLAIIILSFIGALMGVVGSPFQWFFVIAGVIVLANAVWGLMDDVEHQSPPSFEGGM
jgi:hypothetical protein